MKFQPESTRRIAVFRALQLGDMLCAVPALRALRHSYPEAEITLLGLPWAASLRERFPEYIDKFIHFPGYPGLPEQPVDTELSEAFRRQMQEAPFDLILQMQGNGSIVNQMLEDLLAGPVAGFYYDETDRDTELFIEYPEGISEIERHLKMLENLGIPAQGTALEFPILPQHIRGFGEFDHLLNNSPYICIHPGSRGSWRQWPPSHFACLADQCAGRGYQIVVTGTANEADITSQVIGLMDYPALDLTGRTNLDEIAGLIHGAELLISNCTGVSHIAAALRTPSIVISMDGEPERWGPLNKELHTTIDWIQDPDFDFVLKKLDAHLDAKAHFAVA